MSMAYFFLALCVLCGVWNGVAGGKIYFELKKRNLPVRFIWIRVMSPFWAHRYRKITQAEQGKPGPLYCHWIISIILMALFAMAAILLVLAAKGRI